MTKQRQLICRIIRESPEHMTAEEIFLQAKAQMPSIAMGTVYRNLSLMTRDGDILCLEIPGVPNHYDKTTRPHDHVICQRCGRVSDVELGDLKTRFSKDAGIDVLDYHLELVYLCPDCQSRPSLQ